MSLKTCFLLISLSLTISYTTVAGAGIGSLLGSTCEAEGGVCFSSNQCCSTMECLSSSGTYGHCGKSLTGPGIGKRCKSDADCPSDTCCYSERIGFRAIRHKSCQAVDCGVDFESPSEEDDENAWSTLKKKRAYRSTN